MVNCGWFAKFTVKSSTLTYANEAVDVEEPLINPSYSKPPSELALMSAANPSELVI